MKRGFGWGLCFGFIGVGLWWGLGCGGAELEQEQEAGVRVVSLAPSLTQVMVELGAGDWVVGVTRHDAVLTAGGEGGAGGGVRVVDGGEVEGIAAVWPTHVLALESPSLGIPSALHRLSSRGVAVVGLGYPSNVAEVEGLILEVGRLIGREASAAARVAELRERLGVVAAAGTEIASGEGGRVGVLVVIGQAGGGVRAVGTGAVFDELVWLAGGQNAALSFGGAAPVIEREGLVGLGAEVVVVLEPGGGVGAGAVRFEEAGEGHWAAALWEGLPGGEAVRVVVCGDARVTLPAGCVVETAEGLWGVLRGVRVGRAAGGER